MPSTKKSTIPKINKPLLVVKAKKESVLKYTPHTNMSIPFPKNSVVNMPQKVPIKIPKFTQKRLLPIARTSTYAFFPLQQFAGTTKLTV